MVYFSENVSVMSMETGQEYQYPMKRGGEDAFLDPHTRSWRSMTPIPELQAILKKEKQERQEKQEKQSKLNKIVPDVDEDTTEIGKVLLNEICIDSLSSKVSLIDTKHKENPVKQKATPLSKIMCLGLVIFIVFILLIVAFF